MTSPFHDALGEPRSRAELLAEADGTKQRLPRLPGDHPLMLAWAESKRMYVAEVERRRVWDERAAG